MGYRSDDKYILYPIYFDKTVSKKAGRRISIDSSIEKPTIEQIAKAAQSFGVHPILQKGHSHPTVHWKHDGRILIDKKGSKQTIIKQISQRL